MPLKQKVAFGFCLAVVVVAVWRYPEAAAAAVVAAFGLVTHIVGF